MVFRRRDKLSWWQLMIEGVWPRAGWRRVISYFALRIRRLPDTPHKVARGMFAGTFVSFLPLPGVQMLLGGIFAWAIRGNILAAILCAFISNPVTTPFIAVTSIGIGQWVLGQERAIGARAIARAFANAGEDLWHNIVRAPFTEATAHWGGLLRFWETVFLPYLVGAVVLGFFAAIAAYYLTIPLVSAYQRARGKRLRERAQSNQMARESKRKDGDGP